MAIAFVNSASTAGGSGGGTTNAVDTSGANLVVYGRPRFSAPTITDSKSNTITPLTEQTAVAPNYLMLYAENAVTGASHDATAAGGSSFSSLIMSAYSGAATSSVLDQQAGASGVSVNRAPGSLTPSEDNCLVVTGIGWDGDGLVLSIDGGFTIREQEAYSGGNNYGTAMADLIQTTAANANPLWTWDGSGHDNSATIAVFKAGVAAPAAAATLALWMRFVGHRMRRRRRQG